MVEVEFVIARGSQLDENIPYQAQGDLIPVVATKIRKLCEHDFGFLRWRDAGEGVSEPEPTASLTITLTDEERTGGTENLLRFSATIEGDQVDMQLVDDIVVYEWWALDKHDAGQLQDTIIEKLDSGFPERTEQIHEVFVRQIPLSREVYADEEAQRIYLPLDYSKLQSAPDTILFVEFKVAGQTGYLKIHSVKQREGQPYPGCVEGTVYSYDMPPKTLKQGEWDAVIPRDLRRASAVEVRMEEYKYQGSRGLARRD